MLISEHYRQQNAQKHNESAKYGTIGHLFAEPVRKLIRENSLSTILDYGCGKRTLEKALGFSIANYDPAIPGLDAIPEPADLVVCTDVLEHVEPECLDAVLDDLRRVTKEYLFATVAMRKANKTLPDGRNTHLIVEQADWWLPQIMRRFVLKSFKEYGEQEEFVIVCKARERTQ